VRLAGDDRVVGIINGVGVFAARPDHGLSRAM
jgi:hypothetical protein